MKKKIPTWVGALLLFSVALFVGCCIWINLQNGDYNYVSSAIQPAGQNQEGNESVFCNSKKGVKMSLKEAREIAVKSECGKKFKGKDICNDVTGTWWMDLDLKKE